MQNPNLNNLENQDNTKKTHEKASTQNIVKI